MASSSQNTATCSGPSANVPHTTRSLVPSLMFCSFQESIIPAQNLKVLLKGTEEFHLGFDEEEDASTAQSTGTSDLINSSFFVCPICLYIAREPVEVPCCRHWYCVYCFLKLLEQNEQNQDWNRFWHCTNCAVCRKHLQGNRTTMNPTLDRLLQYKRIRVKCSFKCGFTGKIDEVSNHEALGCTLRPVHCPFPDCQCTVKAEMLSDHLRFCPKRAFYCPNCCLPVRDSSFSEHNCVTALKRALTKQREAIQELDPDPLRLEWMLGEAGQPVCVAQSAIDEQSPTEVYCLGFELKPPVKLNIGDGFSAGNQAKLEFGRKPIREITRRKREQSGRLVSDEGPPDGVVANSISSEIFSQQPNSSLSRLYHYRRSGRTPSFTIASSNNTRLQRQLGISRLVESHSRQIDVSQAQSQSRAHDTLEDNSSTQGQQGSGNEDNDEHEYALVETHPETIMNAELGLASIRSGEASTRGLHDARL